MSETWARAALKTYRIAGSVLYPFSGLFLRMRARAGKEDPARRRERFGYASHKRPDGPLVWFHAASVGEFMAILPFLRKLEKLNINIVLTTGTVTSAKVAKDQLSSKVIHQYVPIDIKPIIKRFLNHWKPDMAIFAESEIWPMTILELGALHIPMILVNARLSDRSFRRWQKHPKLAEALFENMAHIVAQSADDGLRFEKLGANKVTVSGNLKVDTDLPPFDDGDLAKLRAQIGTRPVWVAVSTHPGEEEIIANVHRKVSSFFPDLLTVLVPRHPPRGGDVFKMLVDRGLNVTRRSKGEPVFGDTDIFLGDTIGEMGLFLGAGQVVFVGKSLTITGGQNPLEPAVMGAAILAGPNVQNFRPTYESLLETGGVRLVRDEEMLGNFVAHLLKNKEDRTKMIMAARKTVNNLGGALEKTFRALDYHINPLRMKVKLETRARQEQIDGSSQDTTG
jgi:3-deoxy-D-manno-octulosonic-acid transferase